MVRPNRLICLGIGLLAATAFSGVANAWGALGHEVVAKIALRHLTPAAKVQVDAILAADTDTLTAPDFASRATWADLYRNGHRETAAWHFVDIEIDHPDLQAECFDFPPLAPGRLASQGPAQDCVVNKLDEFTAELNNPKTPAPERALALKFVLHFVGDLHQPLHDANHNDRGGNCIGLDPSPDGRAKNLHAFWDTMVVEALGSSADEIATKLDSTASDSDRKAWSLRSPREWAMKTFQMAQRDAYALPFKPTCTERGSVALSPAYQAHAKQDAALQLEKAGVRLAVVLNRAFDR